MNSQIRHRRLSAFYRSKVLNALMMVIIVSLMLVRLYDTLVLPAVCGTVALLLFIGYSAWLWIKKPAKIVVNDVLSDLSGYLTLYWLIIMAMDSANQWWYIFPIVCSVIIMFIILVRDTDEVFVITE
ncbi:MAG: hypothetical protein K2M94_06805 [Paramuribaculum sp.]|nr:hypothetical protein [Paramuribaculum sp.]